MSMPLAIDRKYLRARWRKEQRPVGLPTPDRFWLCRQRPPAAFLRENAHLVAIGVATPEAMIGPPVR